MDEDREDLGTDQLEDRFGENDVEDDSIGETEDTDKTAESESGEEEKSSRENSRRNRTRQTEKATKNTDDKDDDISPSKKDAHKKTSKSQRRYIRAQKQKDRKEGNTSDKQKPGNALRK